MDNNIASNNGVADLVVRPMEGETHTAYMHMPEYKRVERPNGMKGKADVNYCFESAM
jgi:hypothetical protein